MKTIVIGYHRAAHQPPPKVWVAGIFGEQDEGASFSEEAVGRAMNVQRRRALYKNLLAAGPNDDSDEAQDVMDKAVEGLHAVDERAMLPETVTQAIDYMVVAGEQRGFFLDDTSPSTTVVDVRARTELLHEIYNSVALPFELRTRVEEALGMRPSTNTAQAAE